MLIFAFPEMHGKSRFHCVSRGNPAFKSSNAANNQRTCRAVYKVTKSLKLYTYDSRDLLDILQERGELLEKFWKKRYDFNL
jgi:hypothetical protein